MVAPRAVATADDRLYDLFGLDPQTPTIGAEISGVQLGGDLSDEILAELSRALLEWKVLFFRDQEITREDHRAFAGRWGALEQHPFYKYTQPGQGDADVATLAKDASAVGAEKIWHNDVTWHEAPSFAAVLRAGEVPPVGGDTLWADTGAVVRVISESGRRVLFVNAAFTQRILGVPADKSNELLRMLYRHVMRPELQVRLRWKPNTIAFWDNRACQHYASSDYYPARRVMERISIAGDKPIGLIA